MPTAAAAYRFSRTQDASATFAEQEDFKAILLAGATHFEVQTVGEVHTTGPSFPLYTASIGATDPHAPVIGFFGGIHGLERIGTQLILAYMRALLFRLNWDELLHRQLQHVRLVFMPIVNPGGMWAHKRANPKGVDLMRNAPQRAESRVPFLAGGQTLSPQLPWYCGRPGAPMETESAALLQVVREQLASHPFSLALDCHSGYGFAIGNAGSSCSFVECSGESVGRARQVECKCILVCCSEAVLFNQLHLSAYESIGRDFPIYHHKHFPAFFQPSVGAVSVYCSR